jgi:hypothetical protein
MVLLFCHSPGELLRRLQSSDAVEQHDCTDNVKFAAEPDVSYSLGERDHDYLVSELERLTMENEACRHQIVHLQRNVTHLQKVFHLILLNVQCIEGGYDIPLA